MSDHHSIVCSEDDKSSISKERRNFILGAGVLAASSAIALQTACSQSPQSSQETAKQAAVVQPQSGSEQGKSVEGAINAALDCIKKGQACNEHCIGLFKAGDTSVADCADALQEMLAICTAFTQLASYKSKHLKDAVKLCISICEDCEKECRKHEGHHAECKACAEACRKCIDECKKLIA